MTIVYVTLLVFLFAMTAMILCGPLRYMKGRHVSRRVVRRIGLSWSLRVRWAMAWLGVPFILVGQRLPYIVLIGAFGVWALDDWLFSDDDGKKRRHEWARVRLRMPKPVHLRPVERWGATPA